MSSGTRVRPRGQPGTRTPLPRVCLPAPFSLVVYTTILGKTDRFKPPAVVNPAIRYVCFTDQPTLVTAPYERVVVSLGQGDGKLLSREIKIRSDHPALGSPEVTLWHDAAFRLLVDPVQLLSYIQRGAEMVALRHPHRNSIEEEATSVAGWGWIPRDVLQRQIATYRAAGFTARTRITSTGICLRRLNDRVRAFNAAWWAEVQQWGYRDQMSIDYTLWKHHVRVEYMQGHYRVNPYARWHAW